MVIGITGGLAGWSVPFAKTKADREASGDPRPSISERYESRDDYITQTRAAAETLVADGYLLQEDVERETEMAGARYDYWTNGSE